MSKRIVFSLLVSTLLGACALDSMQVVAQQLTGSAAPDKASAAVLPAKVPPTGGAAVATLQADPGEDATQDEFEPDITVKPESSSQKETVAAPPPLPPCPSESGGLSGRVAVQICQQIRTEPPPTRLTVQNRELHKLDYLIPFYAQRNYQMAWLDANGRPLPVAADLLKALGEAEYEGLRSGDYGRNTLQKLEASHHQGGGDGRQLAEFDLLLTDTYLSYASHLLAGRAIPRKIDPEWAIKPRARDLAQVLSSALSSGDIAGSLRDLPPKEKGYTQLRDVLNRYRKAEQAGGWPVVSGTLGPGAQGAAVRNLRLRLQASGDLAEGDPGKAPVYDKAVADAVRRFQKRHGLGETGSVNGSTLAALNVSASQRIRQIELNMERWRWMPDQLGSRYILVNIPNFKMNVIENGKPVMEAKVVVGREERQTPTFTANMAYLVMSPKWYVPRSIAVKDKLPQLKRNPYALARQNIRIYNNAGQQINPASVNWKAIGKENFNYQFRQDAGPRNALGGIKFMFPNPYNVYLHDTPTRGLFSQSQRTFSSGCIRLSNPVELAEYLLKHDPKWNRQTIKAAASSGKQRVVNLPQEVPVYLLYWTVWVDENGLANFRGDIYNRDKPMVRALYQDGGAVNPKGA